MYLCICNGVTDHEVRKTVREKGVSNLRGVRRELGACTQCGKCALATRQIVRETLQSTGLDRSNEMAA
jgi:bacterioferritin-associated ferredoxin